MAKTAAKKKALTKSQIISNIAEQTELTKKEVNAVFEALGEEVRKALGRNGAGQFTIPGLVKLTLKKNPRRPEQKNWLNPFTKEIQTRPAKPATTTVKVRVLKNLKDMV